MSIKNKILQLSLFLYLLIITYFIVYRFILLGLYYKQSGGGDFSSLYLVFGIPLYCLLYLPILIYFLIKMSNDAAPFFQKIINNTHLILPLAISLIIFVVLSINGGSIFQSIYDMKTKQLEDNVSIQSLNATATGAEYNPACECDESVYKGEAQIRSNISFPLDLGINILTVEGNQSCDITVLTNKKIRVLKPGDNTVEFTCKTIGSYDDDDITYHLDFNEEMNEAVRVYKRVSPNGSPRV
jgi:hypothetical protein